MKSIKEKSVFMEYPKPFIRLQKDEKSVNMPYLHFHEGYEIYVMIEGEVDYILSDDTYSLTNGTYILINPFEIHKKVAVTDSYTTFLINFNEKVLNSYFTQKSTADILSVFGSSIYGKLSAESTDRIMKIGEKLEACKDECSVASLIAETLCIIERATPMKSTHPEAEQTLDKVIYEYVANNLDKKITLDMLASNLYISKQTLITSFRKLYGASPIDFVNTVRLNFARSMLIYPEFSISTICNYCGFGSQSYFSKMFKNVFGQTPTEYRKKVIST